MEIFMVDFESPFTLELQGKKVTITPFKERDPNIIKLGIDAPKSMTVNREEIHLQLLQKTPFYYPLQKQHFYIFVK